MTTAASIPRVSFDGSAPPPRLVNTGTDYEAIFQSLAAYRTWLVRHHPDPALVSEAYVTASKPYTQLADDLRLLRDGDVRYYEVGQWFEVTVASADPGLVGLRVREHIEADQLVDPQGRITDEQPRGPINEYAVVLTSDTAGRWRVGAVTRLAPRDPQVLL